ncbi:MAG TPA: hypothetical protein VEH62_00285 [Gemmatimonadales bacterium]|nr:hypothetical protein [Gemmatimonadales bacterium]
MPIPVVLLLTLQLQSPYADSATAALIARARARHREQDSAVHDYSARLLSRLDANFGRGGFARLVPLAVQEQESQLQWQAPNDLRIVEVGERSKTIFPSATMDARWTRPWFVPRFLGDSIRLLSDQGFPERAAVHPLAPGADAFYAYAIVDSLQIALPGRVVRAVGVRVTPLVADAALIAGELWLDAETAETVRLSFVFVGRRLWVDSIGATGRDTARADREGGLVERILRVSADLEYGLYQEHFWLPYRQAVTLDVRLPWFKNLVVPIHFITTFRDVRVNAGRPLVLADLPPDTTAPAERHRHGDRVRRCGDRIAVGSAADTLTAAEGGCVTQGTWAGGRFEVDVPPDSVLHAYRGWSDSLQFDPVPGDAARLEDLRRDALATLEHLPDSLTGRPRLSLAFDRLTDIWRYNRAEGASLGAGYEWRLGVPYVALLARARYAFTDQRLQGALTLRRDAPTARVELEAYREMRDADPLAPGLTFANSVTGALFARDDGAYVFAQGGALRYQRPLAGAADLTLEGRYADESAPRRLARAGVNALMGGRATFQANDPVAPGRYWIATAELAGGARPVGWRAGLEGTAGARQHGRAWLLATARTGVAHWLDVTASGWAGVGVGDSLPQRDFRLGGEKTLRGYAAGAFRGASAWALSVDVGLAPHTVTPVIFADAGQAAQRTWMFGGQPAASVGAGVSLFHGIVRLDVARPVAPVARWRWSLIVGARR